MPHPVSPSPPPHESDTTCAVVCWKCCSVPTPHFSSGCCPMAAVTLLPSVAREQTGTFPGGFHDMGIGRLPSDTPSETRREHPLSFTQGPDGSLNVTQGHGTSLQGLSFSGIPSPGVNTSAEWGPPVPYGVLHVAKGVLLTIAQVIWNGEPIVHGADGPARPTSLIVFRSSDGYHWTFTSVLSNASWTPGGMGPSENDLELLSDNRTVMAVIRPDGDSACSTMTYRYYQQAFSTDMGQSWTRPESMPGLGCARPRLKRLPAGPLLLSGGRDCVAKTVDISLWVSDAHDARQLSSHVNSLATPVWTKHSISYQVRPHNEHTDLAHTDHLLT